MNPNYDLCIRQPRKAAERITELETENANLREALEHTRMEEEDRNDADVAKYECASDCECKT